MAQAARIEEQQWRFRPTEIEGADYGLYAARAVFRSQATPSTSIIRQCRRTAFVDERDRALDQATGNGADPARFERGAGPTVSGHHRHWCSRPTSAIRNGESLRHETARQRRLCFMSSKGLARAFAAATTSPGRREMRFACRAASQLCISALAATVCCGRSPTSRSSPSSISRRQPTNEALGPSGALPRRGHRCRA